MCPRGLIEKSLYHPIIQQYERYVYVQYLNL